MYYGVVQSRCCFGLDPKCPLVSVARDASPPCAVVLRASLWLGVTSAVFAIKGHGWAWPACPQVEFGIHLVLGRCLWFSSSRLSSFFNGTCHQTRTGDRQVWSWLRKLIFPPVQVTSVVCISSNVLGGAVSQLVAGAQRSMLVSSGVLLPASKNSCPLRRACKICAVNGEK